MAVIPSGTEKYINWGEREAAANEALVKLFLTLMARREEHASNNALRRELHYDSQAGQDRRYGMSRDTQLEIARMRNPPPATRGPSPLSTGAQGYPQTSSVPVPTSAPSAGGGTGTIPGAVVPQPSPGTSSFQKTSAADQLPQMMLAKLRSAGRENGADQQLARSDTSDEEDAGALPVKALPAEGPIPPNVIPKPNPNAARPKPATSATPTQLPKSEQPANPRAKPKASAMYAEIDQGILDHFAKVEDKYKLPRGVLITMLGRENGGGYEYGRNGNAEGWFQFTDQLIKDRKIDPADRSNIWKMAEHAGKNLRDNHTVLEKVTDVAGKPGSKITLGTSLNDIPKWLILHQYGIGNGPRFLAAIQNNPNVPLTSLMLPEYDSKGNKIDPARTLARNGMNPNATAGSFYREHNEKVQPWLLEGVKVTDRQPDAPQTPQQTQVKPQQGDTPGVVKTTEVNTTQQPATGADTGRRKQVLGDFTRAIGVKKKLVMAVRGGAELALPDGYKVVATSGHRPGGDSRSHHHRRDAIDIKIVGPDGKDIPNKGPDTTGMYTLLKRGIKTWTMENQPDLMPSLGNGGAFGTQIGGGGVPDHMHIDLGGDRGRMDPSQHFARLPVLKPEERQKPGTTTAPTTAYAGGAKPEELTPLQATAADTTPKGVPSSGVAGKSDLLGKDTMMTNFTPAAKDSTQSQAFAGAPPNVEPPPLPTPDPRVDKGRPQITRGAPPTAPPPEAMPPTGGTSPEFEGVPSMPQEGVPVAAPQAPQDKAVGAIPDPPRPPPPVPDPPPRRLFGQFSFAGPQAPQQEAPQPQAPQATGADFIKTAPRAMIDAIFGAGKTAAGNVAELATKTPPTVQTLPPVQDIPRAVLSSMMPSTVAPPDAQPQPPVAPPVAPPVSPYELNAPDAAITGEGLNLSAVYDWLANKFKTPKVQQQLNTGPRKVKTVPLNNEPQLPNLPQIYVEPKRGEGPQLTAPPAGVVPQINTGTMPSGGGGGAVGTIIRAAKPGMPGKKIGPNGTEVYYEYEEAGTPTPTPEPELPPPDVEQELTAE